MAKLSTPSPADDIKSGNHRKALEAMRDILTDHLVIADPNVSAQIAARLQSVLTDLAALPAPKAESTVDQIRAQRAKRRAS